MRRFFRAMAFISIGAAVFVFTITLIHRGATKQLLDGLTAGGRFLFFALGFLGFARLIDGRLVLTDLAATTGKYTDGIGCRSWLLGVEHGGAYGPSQAYVADILASAGDLQTMPGSQVQGLAFFYQSRWCIMACPRRLRGACPWGGKHDGCPYDDARQA